MSLPVELDARVRREAARRGTTISAVIRDALRGHLGVSARPRLVAAATGHGSRADVSEQIEAILSQEPGA